MLEILAIVLLCKKNSANARARGRKPGGFVALTIGLWVGLELIGAVIGAAAELEFGAYVLALAFAAIGGTISYFIAKGGKANSAPSAYGPAAQPYGAPSPQGSAFQRPNAASVPNKAFVPNAFGSTPPAYALPGGSCPACGEPLPPGADFCGNCGAVRLAAAAPVPREPGHPAADVGIDPKKAVLAGGFLLGAWLLIYLIHFIPGAGLLYSYEASAYLAAAMLGVGIFLLLARERRYLPHAVAALAVTLVLAFFNGAAVQMNTAGIGMFRLKQFPTGIAMTYLGDAVVEAIVAAGAALLFGHAFGSRAPKARMSASGWATAGVCVAASLLTLLFRMRFRWRMSGMSTAAQVFSLLIEAAVIGLTVMLLYSLCRKGRKAVTLSTPTAVCLAVFGAFLVTEAIGVSSLTMLWRRAIVGSSVELVFALFALAGVVLLLYGNFDGWYLLLGAAGIFLAGRFFSMTIIKNRYPVGVLALYLSTVVFPLLLWLLLRLDLRKTPRSLPAGDTVAV